MYPLLKTQLLMAIIFLFPVIVHAGANQVMQLHEITVTEKVIRTQKQAISPNTLEAGRFINIGEMLGDIPGVGLIRRGASATEPIIRGMGWERVATQMNHLPIYGACPARMDPPVAYGRSHAVEEVVIIKGLPSVTLGPAKTGGRIIIKTDYERKPDDTPGIKGWLTTNYDDSRKGSLIEVGCKGGNRAFNVKAALAQVNYGDYSSAKGIDVPASQEDFSGSLSLAVRPSDNHRWWNHFNYVREDDVDYPSLPMNLVKTNYMTFNTGYRIDVNNDSLKQIELEVGVLDVDHTMSNDGKPSRKKFHNSTDTISESFAAHTDLTWQWDDQIELKTGIDYSKLKRDALRRRVIVETNQEFFDHIWPDVSQKSLGGFIEANMNLDNNTLMRVGGRIDHIESDVNKANSISLQKKTILENYVRFNGPPAGNPDASETIGSGNLLFEWAVDNDKVVHIGAGFSTRAAGLTERYFAFAPAPGAYQVGNPTLDPETKYEIDTGIDIQHERFAFSLSGYHAWVTDYILPIALAQEDVNGDGSLDLIRGFTNVDAELYGLEAELTLKLGPHWSLPMGISAVRGKNKTGHRDLPEIPPVEGHAALRYSQIGPTPWWV